MAFAEFYHQLPLQASKQSGLKFYPSTLRPHAVIANRALGIVSPNNIEGQK